MGARKIATTSADLVMLQAYNASRPLVGGGHANYQAERCHHFSPMPPPPTSCRVLVEVSKTLLGCHSMLVTICSKCVCIIVNSTKVVIVHRYASVLVSLIRIRKSRAK